MFKSWSGTRKKLEQELICDKLKGRVKYFITRYNNAHDESARFAILIDNKEVIKGNEFLYYQKYSYIENKLKSDNGIPMRKWNGKYIENEEINKIFEKIIEKLMEYNGEISEWQFHNAIEEYLNQPIEKSINSDNPFIRMFAILDRRVGKRTLNKLKVNIDKEPKWLQQFYLLRLETIDKQIKI